MAAARYATTRDGLRIAYSRAGNGPPLVYVRGFNSHCELWWQEGWTAAYFRALAARFEVVLFDARGNGLSDATTEIDIDRAVEDLRAVVEHADLSDITLYGQGFGAPIAIAYAAAHADRLARLVLYCAYARGREIFVSDTFIETFRKMPDAAAAFMGRETYPDDEDLPTRLLSMESVHASPATAVAYFEFVRSVDVLDLVPAVTVPTLVMQPDHNPQIRQRLGLDIAERIPGAEYRPVPGGSYNPYARQSFQPTLSAIGAFTGVELARASRPVTVLLTDMVSSTAMTQRLGESVSRELHSEHDEIVREAVRVHGGTVAKHTGDGMMISFGAADDAIECAIAIQQRCASRNQHAAEALDIRIGLAPGDAYIHNDEPFTATAQLVTRVTAEAGAGEIVAADPLPPLRHAVAFGEPRSVRLKGFVDPARVRRILWDAAR